MFLLHSVPNFHYLSYAWVALFGALLLIILADESNSFEKYMHHIEWATLLFFAALFVLMECLSELGLVTFLGDRLKDLINTASVEVRLTIAITSILWVSIFTFIIDNFIVLLHYFQIAGVGSAFVDNIPLSAMMLKILRDLHLDKNLNLPLFPLIFSLAFAAGLGGLYICLLLCFY